MNEEEVDEPSTMLVEHFYDIELPQHKNAFQQFYYLLYRQEALRFFNSLIFNVEKLEAQLDKDFQVGKAMDAVRVLCIQINDALKDYDPTLQENEITCYALTVARSLLIALFFEIQDYFSLTLENPIPQKFFFQNYLHIPYDPHLLKISPAFYENFYLKMYQYDWFEIRYAKDMMSQIKGSHLKNNEWLLARYENGIFLYENGYSQKLVYDDFFMDCCDSIVKAQKKEWKYEIDKFTTGHKRLLYINELLDELEYVSDNRNNKHSIPSRLYRFLIQQKEIYSSQLSVTFQSDISLHQNQTITFETTPSINNPGHSQPQIKTPEAQVKNENTQKNKIIDPTDPSKFRFGFRERKDEEKVKALRSCILSLDKAINLLNEDNDNLNQFMDILLATKIVPSKHRINIGCETAQFKYVINKLEPYFTNLNQKSIGWSQCFFSKKGNVINSQNLYSSNAENPKLKKEMDDIFREFL